MQNISRLARVQRYLACTALACALCLPLAVHANELVAWPTYGNDAGSSKYSPLAQITPGNLAQLEVAWRWASPDNVLVRQDPALTPWTYKVTPIMVEGVLYLSTSLNQVAAIDASTGRELWVYDTRTWAQGRPTNLGFNHRGVAYWSDGKRARVLMPTNDGRLFALDAHTGRPDPTFGNAGHIDLTLGLGRQVQRKHYSVISAPMVVGDIVIVGSSIWDGPQNKEAPPGHIRGFDVRTGEQRWIFRTIPQGKDFGADTWEDESWAYSGNTNMWTLMSADLDNGLVYLPIGTPTNDWYGGHRRGANLFGETLVCLDALTGERVWHYQLVHHGLWDYDPPAAPNVMDITVAGKRRHAVALPTKQGFLFVFDRFTGEPIWPIEERAVPPSDVPGERAALTQPFPTHPAPFVPQGFTVESLIDFTPELYAAARKLVAPLRLGPLYTPPSLQGTVQLPGWGGGANWTGAAFDPQSQHLFVPASNSPIVVKLEPPDPATSNFRYVRSRGITRLPGPAGLPINKPPYSSVTAIDMSTGNQLWQQPLGNGPRQKFIDAGVPDPGPLGGARGPGPLVTPSALFMAYEDSGSPRLFALDKVTGNTLSEVVLPATPGGTPMTYAVGGRQYIALALGQGDNAELVALTLPLTLSVPLPPAQLKQKQQP